MQSSDNIDHFTERARRVLALAQEEAQELNHPYLGAEHILLGLLREGDSLAARVLQSADLNLERAREAVVARLGRGEQVIPGEPDLAPHARRVLEYAVEEAGRLSHRFIGTEHLLLGLIKREEDVHEGVLTDLALDLAGLRFATVALIGRVGEIGVPPRNVGSFDRFTERARKVLTLAQEEAQRFNHSYIGTEHLLLGLIQESEGVAAKVLSNLDIELTKVRSAVDFIIGRGEPPFSGAIGLTPRAKKVIELAVDEARGLGHHYIGTEHLLLGLIREEVGVAARVLESMGVTLDGVRSEVVKVLTQAGATPTTTSYRSSSLHNDMPRHDFDEAARRSIQRARDEAQRFNHNYVGTEHLLLGLVGEADDLSAQVLNSFDVEVTKVRSAVEFIIGRGEQPIVTDIGLTPRSLRVFELARDEAHGLGHQRVGTGHLLLGLIREGEGIGAGVLESLGVNLVKARTSLLTRLQEQERTSEQADAPLDPESSAANAGETAARPRWEYLVLETIREGATVRIFRVDEQEEHRFSTVSLHWALQVLGDEAWELLGIDPPRTNDEGGTIYLFKRQKN